MSFFTRHPRFWITMWSMYGFGGIAIGFNAVFDLGFNAALFIQGLIGAGVAGMMIAYLLPHARSGDAKDSSSLDKTRSSGEKGS